MRHKKACSTGVRPVPAITLFQFDLLHAQYTQIFKVCMPAVPIFFFCWYNHGPLFQLHINYGSPALGEAVLPPDASTVWRTVKRLLDIKVSCEYPNKQQETKTGTLHALRISAFRQRLAEKTERKAKQKPAT